MFLPLVVDNRLDDVTEYLKLDGKQVGINSTGRAIIKDFQMNLDTMTEPKGFDLVINFLLAKSRYVHKGQNQIDITGTAAGIARSCFQGSKKFNFMSCSKIIWFQLISGPLAFFLAYVSCTTMIQRFGFTLPLWCVQPICLILAAVEQGEAINSGERADIITGIMLLLFVFLSFFSVMACTKYAWREPDQQLQRVPYLFVRDVFASACGMLDSTLILNLRRYNFKSKEYSKHLKAIRKRESQARIQAYERNQETLPDPVKNIRSLRKSREAAKSQNNNRKNRLVRRNTMKMNEEIINNEKTPYIFVCPTLYRETADEMLSLMKSILKLNKDQIYRMARFKDKSSKTHKSEICYKLEFNTYFDKCFERDEKDSRIIRVNSFVDQLAEIIDQVGDYIRFDPKEKDVIKKPKICETPYGIRLEYELPVPIGLMSKDERTTLTLEPNKFYVHLKDSNKVQNGKRWSQNMYMYYILSHRQSINDKEFQKKYETYILALDGDVDFQPDAMLTLLTRIIRTPKVGAACGRIHPLGFGPVYYYQLFEYAVGHWLQKAAEHVLGCVLCSPGCFSLIRGKALLCDSKGDTDSAIGHYIQRPKKSLEYVQWNQGEDRWLCTLLLQKGWRIEYVAISDAFTNAPTEITEFFNQRRRWGPSTLFNIYDLVKNGKSVRMVNDYISGPYLLYQQLLNFAALLVFGGFKNVRYMLFIEPYDAIYKNHKPKHFQ